MFRDVIVTLAIGMFFGSIVSVIITVKRRRSDRTGDSHFDQRHDYDHE